MNDDNDDKRLMPIQILARKLGAPSTWLRAEAEGGRLPCVKVGRSLLFDYEVIEATLRKRASSVIPEQPKFVQLIVHDGSLHALDEHGGVHKYCPADERRFAFWTKYTDYRVDPKKKKEK